MIAIPAVDIKGGKCVRLRRGEMDEETIFSDHPEEVAQQWEGKGAKRLHIVDLDGAVHGETFNIKTVEKVYHLNLTVPNFLLHTFYPIQYFH